MAGVVTVAGGTTWLKALLYSITHRSDENNNNLLSSKHPQELIPSLETNLYVRHGEKNEKSPESLLTLNEDPMKIRVLGTHIPYQILGDVLNSSECKIVYVTRNPKDTLVSLWHFVCKSEKVEEDLWELEAAVDQFCNGIVVFGSFYDHVLGYREESVKRPDKVFLVTYEEMQENPKKCVKELGEFLACPFDEGENGEMEISEIVRNCSFEKLSNQGVNKSSELPDGFPLPYSSFFRKGQMVAIVKDKYYLEAYRAQMMREFWELRQRPRSVDVYERDFTCMKFCPTPRWSTEPLS
ncbi:Cytosolic sulfotransferase 5 [Striga hermonthica]|uniref:Sulfotransferase n=1 Tax=Striga hermonthica TaxID=68872 RepID=A0A9N7R1H6_STRHE|nr:Cytosolic sulfotransferase 5 [Striga hermonthica]